VKKIVFIFSLLFITSIAEAQWIKGFAIRSTAGYCGSEPANATYYIPHDGGSGDSYPTTRNSVTFGNTNQFNANDENNDSGLCSLGLAGRSYIDNNAATSRFHRIDLPNAGDYDFKISSRSPFTQTDPRIRIYDNTTLLWTIEYTGTMGSNDYLDANNTVHTSATNWGTNNTAKRLTFSTTTAFVYAGWGDGSHAGSTSINFFEFAEVTPTPTPTPTPGTVTARKGQDCAAIKGQCLQ
jgi:hypothetical protein